MDELVKYSDAFANLLFGIAYIGLGIQFYRERRNSLTLVMSVLIGAAFMAFGLSIYMELMAPKWIGVSREAVLGIVGMWIGISALCGSSLSRFPMWTRWAMLVVGAAFLLNAAKTALF